MRAAVRSFHSPDTDLAAYVPADEHEVGLLVEILVGPADGAGEETFTVVVCTPTWLQRLVAEQGPVLGRHYVIVERFMWPSIEGFLTRRVEACTGPDWRAVAEKLAHIGHWEFEDYEP